jgi:hypothetical protein
MSRIGRVRTPPVVNFPGGQRVLVLNSKMGFRFVPVDEIVYIASQHKRLFIRACGKDAAEHVISHTQGSTIDFENLLGHAMVRASRFALINPAFVDSFSTKCWDGETQVDEVTFCGVDDILSISRRCNRKVRLAIEHRHGPPRSAAVPPSLFNAMRGQSRLRPFTEPVAATDIRVLVGGDKRPALVPIDQVAFLLSYRKRTIVRTLSAEFTTDESLVSLEARFGEHLLRTGRDCLIAPKFVREIRFTRIGNNSIGSIKLLGIDEWLTVTRRRFSAVRDIARLALQGEIDSAGNLIPRLPTSQAKGVTRRAA